MAPLASVDEFNDVSAKPAVRGFLHTPREATGDALVLTHGAGGDCRSKLLVALAEAFAEKGFLVLRCNLPFRQKRPHGPPFPGSATEDQAGLRRTVEVLRARNSRRIFLGGHSYGGRQASMLGAAHPDLVSGLLLLSYPLHPPRKPAELRTAHFPRLSTPALFVHGSRDPFGSWEEMSSAIELIPARHMLFEVEGAGHELLPRNKPADHLALTITGVFRFFDGGMAEREGFEPPIPFQV